jgi:DNA-binding NarL/FixJ family response regulator
LIVEDHEMVRDALADLLRAISESQVVGVGSSLRGALPKGSPDQSAQVAGDIRSPR